MWLGTGRFCIRTCWATDLAPVLFLNRLCGCSISSFCCQDLASALTSNRKLEALDLGQNTLEQSGITVLLEALKQSHGPLTTLRLKLVESSGEIQKLLQELKDSNPRLTIDGQNARVTRSSYGDFLFCTPWDNAAVSSLSLWHLTDEDRTVACWSPGQNRNRALAYALRFTLNSAQLMHPLYVKCLFSFTRIQSNKRQSIMFGAALIMFLKTLIIYCF